MVCVYDDDVRPSVKTKTSKNSMVCGGPTEMAEKTNLDAGVSAVPKTDSES